VEREGRDFLQRERDDYFRRSSMHCTVADLAALDASRKADGTAADSLADSLKDRVNKLQAQLDELQKQKDDAQLQLSAHLKAEVSC
jgi:multidrug resistance efflux pump